MTFRGGIAVLNTTEKRREIKETEGTLRVCPLAKKGPQTVFQLDDHSAFSSKGMLLIFPPFLHVLHTRSHASKTFGVDVAELMVAAGLADYW